MLFVRAANEGRFLPWSASPKEKVVDDIENLVDRMIATRDPKRRQDGQWVLGLFGSRDAKSVRAS